MKKSILLFLLISFLSSGRTSVLLYDPKNICSETGGSYVLPGQVVTLLCVVDNTGAPGGNIIIWNTPVNEIGDLIHINGALYQNNSIFSSTATFDGDLANATLTFTTTQSFDDKVVTCRDNVAYSKSCTLLIYTTPSAIRNLTMKSITYKSVNLSWNTPSDTGGYNTVNYIITVTPLDSGNSWNITTTDNSTSYTVTRLKSGQRYNFIMRTNNSIGLGDKSNTITALIPGEVPGLIQDVKICFTASNGNYLLNIYWNCSNTVDDITPPVTNYTVDVDGSIIYTFFPDNCPSSDSPFGIQTINNTQYSINVSANNILGSSIASSIVIRNFILITSDIELSGETFILLRIRITWNSPCIDRVQVIISYYKTSDLNYVTHNSSSSYCLVVDVISKLFFIENLDPGSVYLYNVSVYDRKELAIVELNKTFYTTNKDVFLSTTQIIKVTNSPHPTYTSSCDVAVSISISITAIVTAVITTIVSSIFTYYCCVKSNQRYSSSVTGPPDPTIDMSSLEIKDNIAYGHVTIDTSGNIHNATVVYDNIVV